MEAEESLARLEDEFMEAVKRHDVDCLDRTGSYLMTDVWVRRGGTWRLVTRHITSLSS